MPAWPDGEMRVAVVAGVGPGLGASLAREFAAEGCAVGLLARSPDYVEELAADLPTDAVAVTADIADEDDVARAFDSVREELGSVDVLVHNASAAPWKGTREVEVDEFDRALAVGPRGALPCSRAALADMDDGGTIILTGATTSVRGRENAVGFSAAKFGVRGLAESMARELGPEGVHVAHVVIDGGIQPPGNEPDEALLDPDAIAENYWQLVEQDRSSWTLELDLRPHVEEF